MGQDGGFITGSDFLMDGGVTAAYWYGELTCSQVTQRFGRQLCVSDLRSARAGIGRKRLITS